MRNGRFPGTTPKSEGESGNDHFFHIISKKDERRGKKVGARCSLTFDCYANGFFAGGDH